jgi:hypothetical protein
MSRRHGITEAERAAASARLLAAAADLNPESPERQRK